MDTLATVVLRSITFGRTTLGLVTRPYETYRRIVEHGKLGELFIILAMALAYFMLASLVRVSSFRPFLLTRQFVTLSFAALGGYVLMFGLLWFTGLLCKAVMRPAALALAWGYTMIPTIVWFAATSLLYVLLPPPRTTSVLGMTFSVLFIVFSVTLLWWKVMLSYLTVRFVMKLKAQQISVVALLSLPVIVGYSVLMYRLGIFKVPFL